MHGAYSSERFDVISSSADRSLPWRDTTALLPNRGPVVEIRINPYTSSAGICMMRILPRGPTSDSNRVKASTPCQLAPPWPVRWLINIVQNRPSFGVGRCAAETKAWPGVMVRYERQLPVVVEAHA